MTHSRKMLKKKLNSYLYIVLLIFCILVGRLFQLQVINAYEFKTQSEENRIRIINREARRGDIITKDGKTLASSLLVFKISLSHLPDKDKLEEVKQNLVEILANPEIDEQFITDKLKENSRKFEPVEIITIPWNKDGIEIISRIEERRGDLPGLIIEEIPQRYYPYGGLAGHILGYVGLINQKELENFQDYQYGMNDRIGKTGIERVAEIKEINEVPSGLRGKKGVQQVEVNAANRPIRELVNIPPTQGNNVQLTINYRLQSVLESSMTEVIDLVKKTNSKAGAGAAVVIDVNTGAILAETSKPEMNPNDFVDGSFKEKQDYYNDPILKPEFNRVSRGVYPPGSTFKMITLMAALENGAVNINDTIICNGAYWKPPFIKCHGVHGRVNFHKALAVSCNTYLQHAADSVGIDAILKVGKQFGLGMKTGTPDILGEEAGILPTPAWKNELNDILVKRRYEKRRDDLEKKYQNLRASATTAEEFQELDKQKARETANLEAQYRIDYNFETKWHPYDTYNVSIGQGSNNFTVLQLANYTATIANGGKRYVPYLIDKILSPQGDLIIDYKPELAGKTDISETTLKEVIKGMHDVTRPGGTSYFLFSSFPEEITVAAKTGTAQTGRVGDAKNKDFHGVFVAFAPVENPQIAFAGLIEYGKSGGGSAGLVAKAVFEEYFGLTNAELDEEEIIFHSVE